MRIRLIASSSVALLVASPPVTTTSAFQAPAWSGISQLPPTSTSLWGKKVKRGNLANNVEPGPPVSKPQPKKRTPTTNKSTSRISSKSASSSGAVSSALADWAASTDGDTSGDVGGAAEVDQSDPPSLASEFVPFKDNKKNKNARRTNQAARNAETAKVNAVVDEIVEKLEGMLKEKSGATLDGIIGQVRTLMTLDVPTDLKSLTAGSSGASNFRLAWVGGDDAICHIGTGLHNVPLARLQEIFLTCKGRNRIELLEVIKLLGPFPNVLNTLQGDSLVSDTSEDIVNWRVSYDSMIDGLGKDIMAGKEENVRSIDLQVYFANENAIVAVVPPEDSSLRADPLEKNGANVLVFVSEEDLDLRLEELRVNVVDLK